ncbi:DUF4167 domain-containing protein [Caulobacter sp. S45]|uniref:DUF4167 domain-containing protein n=1 Tax=Caulobacter sp. S45 TaxID=1641861 RepID=UPI001575290E|nr:DUF4167 domain-containing protein [Caulobacter sp. S45]
MRDFKNMKRQRGRNRSGGMGGGNNGGGGGGKPQQNANRAFDSNGPDNVKIRGHAQHVFEKYQQLARDAFSSGDRVVAENYLQHADHYFRVLRTLQPNRSPSEILGRDSLTSNLDIDFEEEFDQAEEQAEAAADTSQELNGDTGSQRQDVRDGQRYERNDGRRDGYESRDVRQDRFEPRREGEGQYREQGQYRDQGQGRDQGQPPYRDRQDTRDRSDTRERQQAPRDRAVEGRDRAPDVREGQDRDRGDRFEGRRDNRRFEGRRENREPGREARPDERRPVEAGPAAEPFAERAPEVSAQPFAAAAEPETSPVLRSQDGGMSEAPAFLQPVSGEEGEARKPRPRRRRTPRSFEAPGDGETPASVSEAEDA